MPEETIFEFERTESRAAVAAYLRQVADALEAGDSITLDDGADSVTLLPPANPTFEVKAEREGEETSIEFELEWRGEGGDGELRIE
jgi:amphi-Trp domain-containing protein